MMQIITFLYATALIFSISHLIISALVMRRSISVPVSGNKNQRNVDCPKISILKPLKGIDDGLRENLRSFFNLDYPNYEIIFGLQSSSDPAALIAFDLLKEFNHLRIKIVIEEHEIGLNPKVNNLNNMMTAAKGEYILISDSNTRVKPDFLDRMMQQFNENKEVGLVTGTIRGVGEKNIIAAFENIHLNGFVTPNVFTIEHYTDIPVVIGKAILMPRVILNQLGGFRRLKDYLAEDHILGREVKRLGYQVKCAPVFVDNINVNWSWKKFINRHTRWAKMRRHMHMAHYLIESLSNPITISGILFILLQNFWGLGIFLLTGIIKIAYDLYIARLLKTQMKLRYFLLIPIKDMLISILWFVPFFSYQVSWRENDFRIRKQTLLSQSA